MLFALIQALSAMHREKKYQHFKYVRYKWNKLIDTHVFSFWDWDKKFRKGERDECRICSYIYCTKKKTHKRIKKDMLILNSITTLVPVTNISAASSVGPQTLWSRTRFSCFSQILHQRKFTSLSHSLSTVLKPIIFDTSHLLMVDNLIHSSAFFFNLHNLKHYIIKFRKTPAGCFSLPLQTRYKEKTMCYKMKEKC